MIRVMVYAANPIVRAGLESIIRSGSVEIVGNFSDFTALLKLLDKRQPDVLVLNDDESIWEQLAQVDGASSPAIVVLSDPASDTLMNALALGVQGVLPSSVTAQEMIAAIEAVAEGLVVFHADVVEMVNLSSFAGSMPRTVEPLTSRELEVLQMLALGLGNKSIAFRLTISEHTVKFHISSIFSKLNASSRTEAVTLGLRQGLILL